MPGKKLDNNWIHPSPEVSAAYAICLFLEKLFMGQKAQNLTTAEALEKKLVNIRILGYLLVFGPTNTSRKHIAKTILTDINGGPDKVIDQGRFYDQYFLRPFPKASTPRSTLSSRPSSVSTLSDVARTTEAHPANDSETDRSTLVRDNNRCMVSGILDLDSWIESGGRWEPGMSARITHCVHIVAGFINGEMEDEQKDHVEHAWAIIRAFGYEDAWDELGGPNGNVDRLENAMTLTSTLERSFDQLGMWFEPTTPDSYKVCSSAPNFHKVFGVPEVVVFATGRPDLPLPSPKYLKIHATRCRVAHMSGAADYYRVLDFDDPPVTKPPSLDRVGSDFSSVLHARLLDLTERGAVVAVSGSVPH